MEMKMQGKITGCKSSKGSFTPQGESKARDFDSTTIYVEARLKGENSNGYASQPYKWGKSENAKKIAHLEFPFAAEITCEQVTDGRGESELSVIDIKPLARVTQKAA